MNNFNLSKHASARTVQRNITSDALDIVLLYGIDLPAGCSVNKRSLRLSQLQELYYEGFSATNIEKAYQLEVVVGDDGCVITCYKINRAAHLRRKTKRLKSSNRNAVK
jgi:hypothetical protein